MTPGPRQAAGRAPSGRRRLVPAPDYRVAMLFPQQAEGCRLQRIVPAAFGWLVEPARGQHPQHVSVGKNQHVALDTADLGDDAIDSAADIRGRFAAGSTVAPERPIRVGPGNLFGGETFVAAVVPLLQFRPYLGLRPVTRQRAGIAGALQRAGQYHGELPGIELGAQRLRLSAPVIGEWNIRLTRMAAIAAPLGVPVAHQHHDLLGHPRSAGPQVDVRSTAADLDVEPILGRGVLWALPFKVPHAAERGGVDADGTGAATYRHVPLRCGRRPQRQVAGAT